MPSHCPKCRAILEEDEICCAQVRYTWKCKSCSKLTTGFALPYGKCFLCGGELARVEDRKLGDPMRLRAIREALQFELNSFHFYRLALDRMKNLQNRLILENLRQNELDHLHELEEKYHAHLDLEVIDLDPSVDKLLGDWLFEGIHFSDDTAPQRVYELAIAMEKRTREHFQKLARDQALEPFEREIYDELAAEEDEHVAMLETELDNFLQGGQRPPARS